MAARERKFSPYVSAGAFMATRRRKIARRENQPNSDAEEEQLISMVSSSASLTNPHTGVTGKRKRSEKDNTASLDSTDRPVRVLFCALPSYFHRFFMVLSIMLNYH